ncbi:DUF4124 domain-containing protein [Usitatibacter palustris]|uniref:DUF4124 domain-containing protein n=1 Tax=Usitatibacter palustris TaxID=2732487 RepID=A0A6M4H510_9PROT|nr:DUF4124 domain-containing protein [Usitatibacter palustris]QJR14686.1 hypothetical protein DSM104440_01496 [Usitatibacter palustris]
MSLTRTLVIAIALALAAPVAHSQVYKWTDKDGRVHYGEKPPEGVKATPVAVPSAPKGAAAATPAPDAAPPKTVSEQEAEFRKRQAKRDEAERSFKQREEEAAEREKICENARKRLEILRTPVPVYTKDEQGNRSYLDEGGRASEIAKEEKREKENCAR